MHPKPPFPRSYGVGTPLATLVDPLTLDCIALRFGWGSLRTTVDYLWTTLDRGGQPWTAVSDTMEFWCAQGSGNTCMERAPPAGQVPPSYGLKNTGWGISPISTTAREPTEPDRDRPPEPIRIGWGRLETIVSPPPYLVGSFHRLATRLHGKGLEWLRTRFKGV